MLDTTWKHLKEFSMNLYLYILYYDCFILWLEPENCSDTFAIINQVTNTVPNSWVLK